MRKIEYHVVFSSLHLCNHGNRFDSIFFLKDPAFYLNQTEIFYLCPILCIECSSGHAVISLGL